MESQWNLWEYDQYSQTTIQGGSLPVTQCLAVHAVTGKPLKGTCFIFTKEKNDPQSDLNRKQCSLNLLMCFLFIFLFCF